MRISLMVGAEKLAVPLCPVWRRAEETLHTTNRTTTSEGHLTAWSRMTWYSTDQNIDLSRNKVIDAEHIIGTLPPFPGLTKDF